MGLRVLHVVPGLDPAAGGPSRSVLGLARAQAAIGASVTLVACGTGQVSASEMTGSGDAAVGAPNALLIRLGPFLTQRFAIPGPRLMSILHRSIQRADIVHLHSLWNGVITQAGWFGRFCRKPMVLSPRGMLDAHNMRRREGFKQWYLRLVEQRNLEALAAFHFLDETERAGCDWLAPARERPCVIQPNGLDLEGLRQRLASVPADLPSRAVPDPAARHLVFLGRLNVIKGLELQLEILAQLRAAGEPAHLHWIGPDDGEWPKLRELATRLGVSDVLHWHGPVYGDERLGWLRAADAVLLTSHYECNSNMAAETLAVGGALVATDTCHLDRAALAGAARVVPRQPGALSAALLELFHDASATAALRGAGIAFARAELDWAPLAARMLIFYQGLLDGSRTCAA
ncbi:hypothetical protein CKO42_19740 [Lamprobacter modestohalophilus]|uniref:Glycosyltransferase subfamily 4-like N-terminal domain-containing protein n=1 Tax=Lamprobacter modestohalophilus TaxID=1064514 RepID=A0A9X0WBY2_9GAMM|nr:glycosyltransferase [Lamprobacter modestohalophilus]MBK1620619.1 hypothetical protein [Lamprobacter modestohalophilus]